MNKNGVLMCARYAVSPNFFGYCGPNKNTSLLDHIKDRIVDHEVAHILSQFETVYPYLRLISQENKIKDHYDMSVVEAYWLGNSLLNSVTNIQYISFLNELLHIEKKLEKKTFSSSMLKLKDNKILPHHAFHVFNIFKKTVKDASFETVSTVDECRIGWGKVVFKSKTYLEVKTKPILLIENKLKYGTKIIKKIELTFRNVKLVHNVEEGDLVSFHWSHICDKITLIQVKNLEYYTQKAIDFYNE